MEFMAYNFIIGYKREMIISKMVAYLCFRTNMTVAYPYFRTNMIQIIVAYLCFRSNLYFSKRN